MLKIILNVGMLLCGLASFISCKKELDCYECKNNKPPVVNAGADQKITLPKDSVLLNGSASTDPDGTITFYKWIKIAGPVSANMINPNSSKTVAKALAMGVYQFELTVSDNGGLSAKDTVQVIVDNPSINQPPIAKAGSDQKITLPIDTAILDGTTSFDPDGTVTSYKWMRISGPASASFIKQDSSQTSVRALVAGVYQFELTVTDNGGLSAKDTLNVMVDDPAVNQPPIACAGADQTIMLPTNTINLDGTCSSDPDNNIAAFAWTKVAGPSTFNIGNGSVVRAQATNLVVGVYQFELRVTDAGGLISKDTLQVTVNPAFVPNCGDPNRTQVNVQLISVGPYLASANMGSTVASAGTKIVFAGGGDDNSRVDVFDTATRQWSTAKLSEGRSAMVAVSLGNKVFIAGGETGDIGLFTKYYSNVDIYDASSNTWSYATLSVPRSLVTATTAGNKVFFAGGNVGDPRLVPASARVDVYNASTNSWSTTSLPSGGRVGLAAATVDEKVYFTGGGSDRIDIYNHASNSWSLSNLNPLLRATAVAEQISGISVGSNIYWTGGCLVEISNVNAGSSSMANLFGPGYRIVARTDSRVVFFKGQLNTFDIYDLASHTFLIGVLPRQVSFITSFNNTIYVTDGVQIYRVEF